MKENETLADIVREMRADIPRIVDANVILRTFADRREAAAGGRASPRAASPACPPSPCPVPRAQARGNAAAMREALELLLAQATEYINKGLVQIPWPLDNACKEARAALAAPPRNCDLYATAKDAMDAFGKYRPLTFHAIFDWLFNPATESEAAND